MTWATDWKMELNKRNNKEKIGAVVGTVLSVNPLKVGILNNKVILDKNNMYICKSLFEKYENKAEVEIRPYTVNASANISTPHGSGSLSSISVEDKKDYDMIIKYKNILDIEDRLLIISSEDNQTYFAIDKLI